MAVKTDTLNIRISPETRALIEEAKAALPYTPTITSIVERGIVLALEELNEIWTTMSEKRTSK